MNVLLVDDDASGMHVRELLFQSLGHQTVSAYCGSEALACFAEQEIELVVLDFCLPDLSGSEVLRQMRASRPACPVIVLSGMWDMPSLVTNMADAIVVKGTGTRPLLEAVSKHTH